LSAVTAESQYKQLLTAHQTIFARLLVLMEHIDIFLFCSFCYYVYILFSSALKAGFLISFL